MSFYSEVYGAFYSRDVCEMRDASEDPVRRVTSQRRKQERKKIAHSSTTAEWHEIVDLK